MKDRQKKLLNLMNSTELYKSEEKDKKVKRNFKRTSTSFNVKY